MRRRHISPELQLRRSALACLLWESQFYEDGVEIAGRIAELVPKVAAEKVAALARVTRRTARRWRRRSLESSSEPMNLLSSSPSTGTDACRFLAR